MVQAAVCFSVYIALFFCLPLRSCPYHLMAPDTPARGGEVRSFKLNTEIDGTALTFLAKTYSHTFTGKLLKNEEYLRRAQEFAADEMDSHSISDTIPTASGGSRTFQLNVSTGDFLVTDNHGNLILYQRLPVGQRGLGKFKDSNEVYEQLELLIPDGENGKVIPGFSLGDRFAADSFSSPEQADRHFQKHVLGIDSQESIESITRRPRGRPSEFPVMLGNFLIEASKSDADRTAIYDSYRDQYVNRAIAFAKNSSPDIITITNWKTDPLNDSRRVLMSYRFNPRTNEIVVMNRTRKTIVTYHKVDLKNPMAAAYLRKLDLPPAATPFEYFLATATASASAH